MSLVTLVTEHEHGEIHRAATIDDMDNQILDPEEVDAPPEFGEPVEDYAINEYGDRQEMCGCRRFLLNKDLQCPICDHLYNMGEDPNE